MYETEMHESRSVMVVDVTEEDIRKAARWFLRKGIEQDIAFQFFRLRGNKFVMIVNSILSVERWDNTIKPEFVRLFGIDRCRFESFTPYRLLDELLTEGDPDVEEI